MKFTLYRTSVSRNTNNQIEIDTLEELKELYNEYYNDFTNEIIINFKEMYIEIYDDWRE